MGSNPTPAPPDFLSQWQSVDQQLPADAPDTMRDAWRAKFFRSNIMPWAMSQGHNPAQVEQEFLSKTEREGKSSMPRSALVAKSALEAAAAPALSIGQQLFEQPEGTITEKRDRSNIAIHDWFAQKRKELSESTRAAVADASKQGIGPVQQFALQAAGSMAGAGIYASPALKLGKFAAELAGIPAAASALEGAAFGGMYEAAVADNGHRMESGLQGAAAGLAMGAFVGAHPIDNTVGRLFNLLKGRVPAPMAEAVEATAKGIATPAQEDLASAAIKLDPEIPSLVEQHVQKVVAANKKAGKPAAPSTVSNTIKVTMSDGQQEVVLSPAEERFAELRAAQSQLITPETRLEWIKSLAPHVADALDKGVEIKSVEGQPHEVREFFKGLDDRNINNGTYDMPVQVRGGEIPGLVLDAKDLSPIPPPVEGRALEAGIPPSSAPLPSSALLPPEAAEAAPLGGIRSAQIQVGDAPPSDFIEKTPNGFFRDQRTGDLYMDAEDVPGMKKRMATGQPWYDQTYSWIGPDGKDIPVTTRHDLAARDITGLKDAFAANAMLLRKGWAAVHGMNVTAELSAIGSESLDTAMVKAAEASKANNFPYVAVQLGNMEGKVPTGEVGDFLMNPTKYLQQNRSRYASAFDESMQRVVGKLRDQAARPGAPPAMEGGEERTLYNSFLADDPRYFGAENNRGVGEKPDVFLNRGLIQQMPAGHAEMGDFYGADRQIPYHEGWHAIFSNFGWHQEGAPWLDRILTRAGDLHERIVGKMDGVQQLSDSMTTDLARAFKPSLRSHYEKAGSLPEEIYTYLSQAIRFKNEPLFDSFVKADTDEAGVLDWHSAKTRDLLDVTAMQPDSAARSIATRRMNDLLNRSTNRLADLNRGPAAQGAEVRIAGGKYLIQDALGNEVQIVNRSALADHLAEDHSAPLLPGDLIDESLLPKGLPRLATAEPFSDRRAPINTNTPPAATEAGGREQKGPGVGLLSYFSRQFMPWMEKQARRLERPDVFNLFQDLKDAGVDKENFVRDPMKMVREMRKSAGEKRAADLYSYLTNAEGADRDFAATELRITPAEKTMVTKLTDMLAPLTDLNDGVSFEEFLRDVAPKMKTAHNTDPHAMRPGEAFVNEKFPDMSNLANAVYRGDIDPRDTNIFNLAASYVNSAANKKFTQPHLIELAKLVNETDGNGNFKLGEIQPLVARVLEMERGTPDYTQRTIHNFIESGLDHYNAAIEKANHFLPGDQKLPTIDATPRDALRRYTQFTYAGGMMLRPATLVRDGAKLMTHVLPVLKTYFPKAMAEAFGQARQGTEGSWWKMAQEAGALLGQDEMLRYSSMESNSQAGKVVQAGMRPLTWANNISRLVNYVGNYMRVQDALRGGVDESFSRRSFIDFLDPLVRDRFLAEAEGLRPGSAEAKKFASHVAKEIVDASEGNYDRLSSPGFHKYAIGRLFGQYGSYPVNYFEFVRRLAMNGSPQFRMQNLSSIAAAHFAVLAAGEATGINTAQWVGSQPLAYGGSPSFQALIHAPGTLDFESQRGADARREVVRPIWPMSVPGGLAAEQTYHAITTDDPNAWKVMLGFHPLGPKDETKGLHQLFNQ